MGIIIKQSVRNAGISYVGILIGFISTIKLFPNILEADQFGLTRVMLAIALVSVQTINFGIPSTIVKFFPSLSKMTSNPGGLFWAFTIPPLIGLCAFIVLYLVFKEAIIGMHQEDADLLSNYYLYVIPLVFFISSFGILTAFAKVNLDTVFASFLQDIFLRVVIILILVLYYFDIINFDHFILLFILNYALQYLLLLAYCIFKRQLSLKPVFSMFNKMQRNEILSYSFFALFSGLTMVLVGNIDLIMVGTFEGLASSGIYAIALYVGAVILVPKKAIGKISHPIISKSFAENDMHNIESVYKQSSSNQYLAGFLIYIGVLANLDNLYAMLPPEYSAGGIVIVIIGLANLFDMITGANGQIIISSKYYRFDFYSSVILMVSAVILNYILIPDYGIKGAALATATSIFIINTARVIYVWVKLRMQPFSVKLIGTTVCGLVILFLSEISPTLDNIYLDILVRSAFITLLFLLTIRFFKLSAEVNNIIDQTLKKMNWQ